MPSKSNHVEQYKKNKELSNTELFNKPENRDWKITLLFYAGMHLVDSHYAVLYHPKTHKKRKEILNTFSNYRDIIDDYENLEMLSRKARYDCEFIEEFEIEDAIENIRTIEEFVNP
ncbi:hypothetical protein ACSW9P_15535 [Clostridium perfringens]